MDENKLDVPQDKTSIAQVSEIKESLPAVKIEVLDSHKDGTEDIPKIKEEPVTDTPTESPSFVEVEKAKIKSEVVSDPRKDDKPTNVETQCSESVQVGPTDKLESKEEEENYMDSLTPEQRRLKYKKEREERVLEFLSAEKVMIEVLEKLKQTYLEDAVQHPDYSRNRQFPFIFQNRYLI